MKLRQSLGLYGAYIFFGAGLVTLSACNHSSVYKDVDPLEEVYKEPVAVTNQRLTSRDPDERAFALKILGKSRSVSYIPTYVRLFENDRSDAVAREAARALAKVPSSQVAKMLGSGIQALSPHRRIMSVAALRGQSDREALREVEALCFDRDSRVRQEALVAIGHFHLFTPSVVSILRQRASGAPFADLPSVLLGLRALRFRTKPPFDTVRIATEMSRQFPRGSPRWVVVTNEIGEMKKLGTKY